MTRVLSIRNRQKVRSIDTALLRRLTRTLLTEDLDLQSYELGLHLLTAPEMAVLNKTYLQHEGSTDVITFNHAEQTGTAADGPLQPPGHLHGEIFVSVSDAIRQAAEFKTSWQSEIVRYVIHGLLHLIGYDDLEAAARRTMKRVENQLVKRMTAAFPVTRLGRPKNGKNGRKR